MTLGSVNVWLAGFFALAAVHYAVQWWFSRSERLLLVASILCALYSAFSLAIIPVGRATTIPEAQFAMDRMVTFGVLLHAVLLQFYASVGRRRDPAFRAVLTLVIVFFACLNQWVPLRGTVIGLQSIQLPEGGLGMRAIRTPTGAPLFFNYLASLTVQGYGIFVARMLWRRDRAGAIFLAVSATSVLTGISVGILVDFAKLHAPYLGALPHALLVVAMGVFFSQEYSARGARVASTGRQFEAAFEHTPIGKALLAPDGRFLRVNRALCRILGSTADEIGARRLHDIVRDDDDGSMEVESRRLLAGEIESYIVEKRLLRKDGAPVWALLAVSVVRDDREQPVQMIADIQDVTELRAHRERLEELVATRTLELREAKDEAERASQAKSRFLAHMSHEIRNPLHVILLNGLLLEEAPALDAAHKKKIETIHKSGQHLATLINDMLEMSKIEAGRAELVDAPFDLGATLDEVAQMFAAQAAANGTGLTIELTPELPRSLLGDGGKVKQVLINLASNAVKFTRGGRIRVTVTSSAAADAATLVEVVVADTGIGIEAQDMARMFQPFEQLAAGANAGGTGLGLAISLVYARLMGGDLSVESAPGDGSRFKFTFVAKRIASEAARSTLSQPNPLGSAAARHKVLIVDDAEVNRDLLAELLAQLGVQTRTAADGAAALAIHADWSPDIVLMDLRMPGMNGLEAIQRLRAAGSRAAIGALTAGAFGNDEREALGAGADFFLRKPYERRELLDRLGRILEARIAATRGGVTHGSDASN